MSKIIGTAGRNALSILVTEELLLQARERGLKTKKRKSFQSSLLRNFFCKPGNVGWKQKKGRAFNPRYWGTSFARSGNRRQYKRWGRAFNPRYWGTSFARCRQASLWHCDIGLSILVTEELLLQEWCLPLPEISCRDTFNPRYWGTSFASHFFHLLWRGFKLNFQSSLLRNFFCKCVRKRTGRNT